MNTEVITFVITLVFSCTALLATVNLLMLLKDIPVLKYLQIRPHHIDKLFTLLILEVIIGITPIGINVIVQNYFEYTYDDSYIITHTGSTYIYYKRPFKFIPNVKVISGQEGASHFAISTNDTEKFVIETDLMHSNYEIKYTVTGVPK